jgi:hypothetical protein
LGKPDGKWSYCSSDPTPSWYKIKSWVVRFNQPDGSKRFHVVSRQQGGWCVAWPPTPFLLYDADRLANANTVYVCEGEKTASHARWLGFTATTSMGGPEKAALSDWSPLKGKHVVILPDFDEAGRKYADEVARLVMAVGAWSVRIVNLPGLCEGDDLCDWWAALDRSITKEKAAAWIRRLVAATEPIAGEIREVPVVRDPMEGFDGSLCLSNVQATDLGWVWRNVIPRRAATVVTGESGIGKSLLALNIAAQISPGERQPDDEDRPQRGGDQGDNNPSSSGEARPPEGGTTNEETDTAAHHAERDGYIDDLQNSVGGVILFLDEDDLTTTVRPRLDLAGASLSQIFALQCQPPLDDLGNDDDKKKRECQFEVHLAMLERELKRRRRQKIDVQLVVIDPLSSFQPF